MVAFFAVLLLITIFSLEAWFYNAAASEVLAKQVPQGPGTPLGDQLAQLPTTNFTIPQAPLVNDHTGYKGQGVIRMPIDEARMNDTIYAIRRGPGASDQSTPK